MNIAPHRNDTVQVVNHLVRHGHDLYGRVCTVDEVHGPLLHLIYTANEHIEASTTDVQVLYRAS